MNLVDAIKVSQWIRRAGWPDWMLASRRGPVLRVSSVKWSALTYADFVADDWEPYRISEVVAEGVVPLSPDEDPSEMRFRLMEIE